MASIHKGGWCGSESIRRLPNEKRRRVCGDGTALRGMTERVSGHEKIGRAIDRGQLNGGPFSQLGPPGASFGVVPRGHRLDAVHRAPRAARTAPIPASGTPGERCGLGVAAGALRGEGIGHRLSMLHDAGC
jgi:hypothetical protein